MAAQAKLMTDMINLGPYSSQTIGGKSYTARSLQEIRGMLEAIQFVLNERGLGDYAGTIVTDFSQGGIPRGQPAGVTDDLSY